MSSRAYGSRLYYQYGCDITVLGEIGDSCIVTVGMYFYEFIYISL